MNMSRDVRILLVDDDPTDLERSVDALRSLGLAKGLHLARGGQEALDYLLGHGGFSMRRLHPLPDVILLDVNMPVVDGCTVLRRIRETTALRRTPVVMLCSSARERERAMAAEVRANSYLVKPIAFDDLSDLKQQFENWTLQLDLPPATGYRAPGWPLQFAQLGR
jgi:two-component system, response regulator